MTNKLRVTAASIFTTGIIVAAVGFSSVSSADGSMWRNDKNVVKLFPTTLSTLVSTFTQGGGVRATSTSGTAVPLLASDFDLENVIDVTLNVQDATLSFPATSTLDAKFLPNAGDTRTIFVRNATTTAATDLTISGGTGFLAKFASTTPATTGVITGDTDGANYAKIDLIRKANTDIEVLVSLFKD